MGYRIIITVCVLCHPGGGVDSVKTSCNVIHHPGQRVDGGCTEGGVAFDIQAKKVNHFPARYGINYNPSSSFKCIPLHTQRWP